MDEFWFILAVTTVGLDGVFILAAAVAQASGSALVRQLKKGRTAAMEDEPMPGARLRKAWEDYAATFLELDHRQVTRRRSDEFFTIPRLISRAMPLVWRLASPGLPLAVGVVAMLAGLSYGALHFESASHEAMLESIKRFFGAAGMSFLLFLAGAVLSGVFRMGKGLMLSRVERNLDRLTRSLDDRHLMSRDEDRRMALDEYLTGVMALSEQTDRLIRENRDQQSTLHRDLLSRFQGYGDTLSNLAESLTKGMARQNEQSARVGRELVRELTSGMARAAALQDESWARRQQAMESFGGEVARAAVDAVREEASQAVREAGKLMAESVSRQMDRLAGAVEQSAGQLARASDELAGLRGEFATALDQAAEHVDRQTREGLIELHGNIHTASSTLREAVDQAAAAIMDAMDRNRAYLGGVLEVLGQTTERMEETAAATAASGERFQAGLDQAREAELTFAASLERQTGTLERVVESVSPIVDLPGRLDELIGQSLAGIKEMERTAAERFLEESESAKRNLSAVADSIRDHLETRDRKADIALEAWADKAGGIVGELGTKLAVFHGELAETLTSVQRETGKGLARIMEDHGQTHVQAHEAMHARLDRVDEVLDRAGEEFGHFRDEMGRKLVDDMHALAEAVSGQLDSYAGGLEAVKGGMAADMARHLEQLGRELNRVLEGVAESLELGRQSLAETARVSEERLGQGVDRLHVVARQLEDRDEAREMRISSLVEHGLASGRDQLDALAGEMAKAHGQLMERLAGAGEVRGAGGEIEDGAFPVEEMAVSIKTFITEQMGRAVEAMTSAAENLRRDMESVSVDMGMTRSVLKDSRMRELSAQERFESTQRLLRALLEKNGNGNGSGASLASEDSMRQIEDLSRNLSRGLERLDSLKPLSGGNGSSRSGEAGELAEETMESLRRLGREVGSLFGGMLDGLREMQTVMSDMEEQGGAMPGGNGDEPAAERIGACLARVSQAARGLAGAVEALERKGG